MVLEFSFCFAYIRKAWTMNSFLTLVQVILSSFCVLFIVLMLAVGSILLIDMHHGSTHEMRVQKARVEANERREKAVRTKDSVKEMLRKEQLRREKEAAAHEGLFQDHYIYSFDTNGAVISRIVRIPTEEGLAYYKTMDELADFQIFDNTEDL
jgi:hypothetical protein